MPHLGSAYPSSFVYLFEVICLCVCMCDCACTCASASAYAQFFIIR